MPAHPVAPKPLDCQQVTGLAWFLLQEGPTILCSNCTGEAEPPDSPASYLAGNIQTVDLLLWPRSHLSAPCSPSLAAGNASCRSWPRVREMAQTWGLVLLVIANVGRFQGGHGGLNWLEPMKPQSCFELPSPELSDQVSYLGFFAHVYTFIVMVSLPTDACLQIVRFSDRVSSRLPTIVSVNKTLCGLTERM